MDIQNSSLKASQTEDTNIISISDPKDDKSRYVDPKVIHEPQNLADGPPRTDSANNS